jgi:excisionase family DNA binding protein
MDKPKETEKVDVVLSAKEAAERLSVHIYTIYKLLNSGKLEGFRINRRWRITNASLNDFIHTKGKR